MCKIFPAFLVMDAVVAIGVIPQAVQARDYPFCIKGENYGSSLGDCAFDTLEQCQATASGRFDFCAANPYYESPKTPASYPRKPRARR